MRLVVFAGVLLSAAQSYAASFVQIHESADRKIYVQEAVKRDGRTVEILAYREWSAAKDGPDGPYRSALDKVGIDCASSKFSPLESRYYAQPRGEGKLVGVEVGDRQWRGVTRGNPMERMVSHACSAAAAGSKIIVSDSVIAGAGSGGPKPAETGRVIAQPNASCTYPGSKDSEKVLLSHRKVPIELKESMNVLTPVCARKINALNAAIEKVDDPVIAAMKATPDGSVPREVWTRACTDYKQLSKTEVSDCIREDFGCLRAQNAVQALSATQAASAKTAAALAKAAQGGPECAAVADIYSKQYRESTTSMTDHMRSFNQMNTAMPAHIVASHCQNFQVIYNAVKQNCQQ